MQFWIAAAALALAATACAVWPLFRREAAPAATRSEHDLEVYGAQLRELEGDAERGAIRREDAAVARAEIGRRLLKAATRAEAGEARGGGAGRATMAAGLAVALALPMGSVLFYERFGSPDVPDLPLASRAGETGAPPDVLTMVAEVERRMRENPGDGRGWDVLAPIYLRLGEAEKAVGAFRGAIRGLGATAARDAGLGEALTQAADGEVTDEAEAAFRRAAEADPRLIAAQFFLALNLSQESRFSEALPAWQAVVAQSPEGSPWLEIAEAALQDSRARLMPGTQAASADAAAPAGPTGEDIAAAAEMPAADRKAMIEGMVSRLAERLRTTPDDVEGWKRLIRSYSTLGNGEDARAALADASAVFPEGSAERLEIAGLARELGLLPANETETR